MAGAPASIQEAVLAPSLVVEAGVGPPGEQGHGLARRDWQLA
jgi:hypothetical protein